MNSRFGHCLPIRLSQTLCTRFKEHIEPDYMKAWQRIFILCRK